MNWRRGWQAFSRLRNRAYSRETRSYREVQNPPKTLPLAEQAVSATKRQNPFLLDTLAWAYFRTGNAPKAVDTELDALHLLPADAKGGIHDELAQGLASFLAAAK